jgi:hypothetical protein
MSTATAQDLTDYRDAFIEAKNAGDMLYDELAAVIEQRTGTAEAASPCALPASGAAPRCFDPNEVLGEISARRDPAIQARRMALRTVAEYNLAIADLVEGKSAEEMQSRVGALAGLIGDLAALASVTAGGLPALVVAPAAASVGQVATRLEQAAAVKNARQSLLQNAGIVDQIIDLLIADTRSMYDVYLIGQTSIALKEPTREATQREQAKIAKFHQSLTAYVKLLWQTKTSLAALISALNSGRQGSDVVVAQATAIKQVSANFWQSVRELRN